MTTIGSDNQSTNILPTPQEVDAKYAVLQAEINTAYGGTSLQSTLSTELSEVESGKPLTIDPNNPTLPPPPDDADNANSPSVAFTKQLIAEIADLDPKSADFLKNVGKIISQFKAITPNTGAAADLRTQTNQALPANMQKFVNYMLKTLSALGLMKDTLYNAEAGNASQANLQAAIQKAQGELNVANQKEQLVKIQEQQAAQAKAAKMSKFIKIFSYVAIALSVVATIASLGTAGPAMVALDVTLLALTVADSQTGCIGKGMTAAATGICKGLGLPDKDIMAVEIALTVLVVAMTMGGMAAGSANMASKAAEEGVVQGTKVGAATADEAGETADVAVSAGGEAKTGASKVGEAVEAEGAGAANQSQSVSRSARNAANRAEKSKINDAASGTGKALKKGEAGTKAADDTPKTAAQIKAAYVRGQTLSAGAKVLIPIATSSAFPIQQNLQKGLEGLGLPPETAAILSGVIIMVGCLGVQVGADHAADSSMKIFEKTFPGVLKTCLKNPAASLRMTARVMGYVTDVATPVNDAVQGYYNLSLASVQRDQASLQKDLDVNQATMDYVQQVIKDVNKIVSALLDANTGLSTAIADITQTISDAVEKPTAALAHMPTSLA